MKRIAFILPLFFITGSALAFEPTILINNSSLPIDDVYASDPGQNAWSNDLTDMVPEGRLDPGQSHEIAPLPKGVYDLRIAAPEFKEVCIIKDVPVREHKVILTDDMFTVCKIGGK